MRAFYSLAVVTLFLTACSSQPIVAPVEQLQHVPIEKAPTPSTEKILPVQHKTALYLCKDQKSVKLTKDSNEKKSITVEFNQTSHKLSSSVPKTGKKKYSNIRWIWIEEFNGSHTLRDKSGKVLADFCIKQ